MSRILSLLATVLALAACSNPTAPNQAASAKSAKASLERGSRPDAPGRLSSN